MQTWLENISTREFALAEAAHAKAYANYQGMLTQIRAGGQVDEEYVRALSFALKGAFRQLMKAAEPDSDS